ncbi:nuclear transport factor 2 family protein [Psychroserpens sp. AS72]|uniref:nuclear transport factor 2 family protein n=1 Tax=Psychroserpens sp. AS72 TaxID=3135775 RepID=UPI00317D96F7
MNFSNKNDKHKTENKNSVGIPNKLLVTLVLVFMINLVCIGQNKNIDNNIIYKTGNPADWPAELDAVIAAPDNHNILLENDQVRVLEVTLAPGEVEKLHHHKWPSTLYIQEAGDFIDSDGEGNIIFDSRKLPEPLPMPFVMYKNPEAPHTVTNLSKTATIRLIRVEMKTATTNQNSQIIDGLYKAFEKGDIPAALGAMDENIVWNEAEGNALASGNPYIGPDAVLNGVFAKLPNDFDNFRLENIVLTEMSNNQVLATLRYKATSKHNGKKLDAQVAHLWTVSNGKITAFQQYVDTKQLDEMMKK